MTNELKKIKRKYGEDMAKFCRAFLAPILEHEGLLYEILMDNFYPSRELYKDIKDNNLCGEFISYIHGLADIEQERIITDKTVEDLTKDAGYSVFNPKTIEELQSMKKYYAEEEELCTFKDSKRIENSIIFFFIKDDIDSIKREDFPKATREDEYSSSLVCVQYDIDTKELKLIVTRRNHGSKKDIENGGEIKNPNAAFDCNLDNFIPGLTCAMEKDYGLRPKKPSDFFEIPGYIVAHDGKFYKYNYSMDSLYFCSDNVIIDHGEVRKMPSEKFIVMDYYLFDLRSGNVWLLYDKSGIKDCFPDTIKDIEDIKISNDGKQGKTIELKTRNKKDIEIILDSRNRIISYKNDDIDEVGDNFMFFNNNLESIELSNVRKIGDNCLDLNEVAKRVVVPKIDSIGDNFLITNTALRDIYLPEDVSLGKNCFFWNDFLNIHNMRDEERGSIKR